MEGDDDIKYFLKNMEVNLSDGNVNINLMDLFPNLRNGFFSITTFVSLLYLYCNYNKACGGSSAITMDKPMKRCFGKTPLDQVEVTTLSDLMGIVRNKTFIYFGGVGDRIMEEKDMALYLGTDKLADNNDVYFFIEVVKEYPNKELYNLLKAHPKVNKLHYSIVFDGYGTIKELLQFNDPRSNNYRSYRLAKERKDLDTTKLIVDSIILRTLLHKEVLTKYNLSDIYSSMLMMF